ncbi:hypothetical protein SSPIM334S_00286 [Streptomyces spiroverticillatus]
MKLLRAADRTAVPWKNGGGITREIAAWPQGAADFDWRVSTRRVAAGRRARGRCVGEGLDMRGASEGRGGGRTRCEPVRRS